MPRAEMIAGMDYLVIELNDEWPVAKGEAPRLAGQFGRFVKIKTADGRLEARVQVRR